MLKQVLMGGVMSIAAPALAQTATPANPVPAVPPPAASPIAAGTPSVLPSDPVAGSAEVNARAGVETPPADAGAAVSAQADTHAATTPAQVAGVVNSEFAGYDKDRSGSLSAAEFGAWMAALRKAGDPAIDPAAPEVKQWIDGAFASADADKDQRVTRAELTAYLATGLS